MERFHAHVGSVQAALKQTPEVLHAVGVNAAAHILNRVIDDGVIVLRAQAIVRFEFITVETRAHFDMFPTLFLQFRFGDDCQRLRREHFSRVPSFPSLRFCLFRLCR